MKEIFLSIICALIQILDISVNADLNGQNFKTSAMFVQAIRKKPLALLQWEKSLDIPQHISMLPHIQVSGIFYKSKIYSKQIEEIISIVFLTLVLQKVYCCNFHSSQLITLGTMHI